MPTPAEEVESIKAQISDSEEREKPKVNFEVGETIKINNGPFLNFSGVIEEIEPERGKLKVTVNIFGRNTPVELEYWQVEKPDAHILWQRRSPDRLNCKSRPARPTRRRRSARPWVSTASTSWRSARNSTPPTKASTGLIIPVVITVYQDKSFTFITKSPPASVLLKKAAGITAGSKTPNKEKVGKVTRKQVLEIVKMKGKDLNAVVRGSGLPRGGRHRPQHGHRSRRLELNRGRATRLACTATQPNAKTTQ